MATVLLAAATMSTAQNGPQQGDEPAARALLKAAREGRESLGANFPGYRGDLLVRVNGQEQRGTFVYRPGKSVEMELPDVATYNRVLETLNSMMRHRSGASTFEQGDGKYVLRLAPPDGNPLGQKVLVGDETKSSYRVRDNQILEVDRTLSDGRRQIITILENVWTPAGHYLPKHYTIAWFAIATGQLIKTDTYTDGFEHVGGFSVPSFRRIVTAEGGAMSVLEIRITDIRLLAPAGVRGAGNK